MKRLQSILYMRRMQTPAGYYQYITPLNGQYPVRTFVSRPAISEVSPLWAFPFGTDYIFLVRGYREPNYDDTSSFICYCELIQSQQGRLERSHRTEEQIQNRNQLLRRRDQVHKHLAELDAHLEATVEQGIRVYDPKKFEKFEFTTFDRSYDM